jgi:hypothetical protein
VHGAIAELLNQTILLKNISVNRRRNIRISHEEWNCYITSGCLYSSNDCIAALFNGSFHEPVAGMAKNICASDVEWHQGTCG